MYVLGGYDNNYQLTNSIEKLKDTDIHEPIAFSLCQLNETILPFMPRQESVFCAWNDRDIIILGGAKDRDEDFGDGWVFNSKTETIELII